MEKYSKKLTKTDVRSRLFLETRSLLSFPPFEEGKNAQDLKLEDEEGKDWSFRLIIRRGRYKKPVLSKGWRGFVKSKQLESGFQVQFSKEEDPAARQVKYKIKIKKPVIIFKAVIGYAPYRLPG